MFRVSWFLTRCAPCPSPSLLSWAPRTLPVPFVLKMASPHSSSAARKRLGPVSLIARHMLSKWTFTEQTHNGHSGGLSGVAECKEHAAWGQMDAVRIQALAVTNHLTSEPQSPHLHNVVRTLPTSYGCGENPVGLICVHA